MLKFCQYNLRFRTRPPVSEDVQHSLGGGEGAVGGQEDSHKGGVSHGERVEEVEHQLLLGARLHALGAGH